MPDQAVVNASPLIFLAKAGMIHFFQQAATQILIPTAVTKEIGRRGGGDITVRALASTSWLTVEAPPIPPLIQAWDLGPGESAVLAHAQMIVIRTDAIQITSKFAILAISWGVAPGTGGAPASGGAGAVGDTGAAHPDRGQFGRSI